MAADCKSAAPRSYGGSNPPLCTSHLCEQPEVAGITSKQKLWIALGLYALLGALAWNTLSEPKFKYATVAILAMFAVRTWSWSRKQALDEQRPED